MALYIWLLLGLSILTQAKNVPRGDKVDKLKWANKFHLRAIRYSLTSGIIEDYEIWKTSKLSRIDYNKGQSKSITVISKENPLGVKYEIYPEFTEEEYIEAKCNMIVGSKDNDYDPETILPLTFSYEANGNEVIEDKYCTKFTNVLKMEGSETKGTIWAILENKTWIPVRYEVIEFNDWLASKTKHEVWDFFQYSKKFSSDKIFDIKSYECENTTAADLHSEDVTKHLKLIDPENDKHVEHVFEAFKNNYKKNYSNVNEEMMRKSILKNNMRLIKENNRRNTGFKLGINKFADKTPLEKNKHMGLLKRPKGKVGNVAFPYSKTKLRKIAQKLPKEYDARLFGLVSEVINQEDCGSCWSIGTTAAVEGALARSNGGRLIELSNQALIDCAWPYGASGCDGGADTVAYEWMMDYGLPTVAEYGPYANRDGECNIMNMSTTYPIRGFTDVTPFSVEALKVALLNHGPLSVSIDATDTFVLYSSGIFYDITCTQTELNHEVTLVGYGERDGETFWILKNSWGPSWGIGGYMHISARNNNCGISTEPTYVVF